MNRRNLFLICPDCHIEQTIRGKFGKNCFFLTALGSIFSIDEFEYAEEINQAITGFEIEVVYLVNDCECRFIHNCVIGLKEYKTKAEDVLNLLMERNADQLERLSEHERHIKMAKLNILRQAFALLDVPFIGSKIENREIILKGIIYDRDFKNFIEVGLPIQSML